MLCTIFANAYCLVDFIPYAPTIRITTMMLQAVQLSSDDRGKTTIQSTLNAYTSPAIPIILSKEIGLLIKDGHGASHKIEQTLHAQDIKEESWQLEVNITVGSSIGDSKVLNYELERFLSAR